MSSSTATGLSYAYVLEFVQLETMPHGGAPAGTDRAQLRSRPYPDRPARPSYHILLMKKLAFGLATFILGAVIGAAIIWFKFAVPAGKVCKMYYADYVQSQAETALQVRFGGEGTFLKTFQRNVPADVRAMQVFGNNHYTRAALRKIKAYYAATGIAVPPDVEPALSGLPPQPTNATAQAQRKSTLTKIGEACPIDSVHTIAGQDVDFHGEVAVLDFFATWCGPCMDEMPSLEKGLWDKFKGEGLIVVGIGQGHSKLDLEKFQRRHSYSFPLVADPTRDIYHRFATAYIPRTVVIGRDGRIRYQSVGYTPEGFAALASAVKTALRHQ